MLAGVSQPSTGEPDLIERRRISSNVWALFALLMGFVGLAVVSRRARYGTAFDHAVLGWIVEHRRGGITSAAIAITDAASPVAMTLWAVVAGATLWWWRSARTGLVVVGTLACATGVSTLTKAVVGAQRPPQVVQLLFEIDPSYPSGHVTATLALVGIVAVVLGRGRGRAIGVAMGVGVASITLVVALTRLYLGVHWLADVLGGALLGGAAVLVGSAALGGLTSARSGGGRWRAESPASKVTRVA